MRFLASLALALAFIILSPLSARADGGVSVRMNDHQQFVRLVMAWENGDAPDYTIRRVDDGTVEVAFTKPGTIAAFHPDPQLPEIADIRAVGDNAAPLKVWVMLARGGFERDLRVGNRLILDIRQNKTLREEKARAQAAATAATAEVAKPADVKPADKTEVKKPEVPIPAAANTPKPKADPVPVPGNEKIATAMPEPIKPLPADPANPPVITLSNVAAFGVTAFIHNNCLWVVVDQPDFSITPRVSGKNIGAFSSFERLELPEATAFHLKLPEGYTALRGEGGGLFWRVVLASPKKEMTATKPRRDVVDGAAVMSWPFNRVGKIVKLTDPESEEDIIAVSVQKSDEFAGPARRFAEFDQANSGIGLAIIPRADDINVTTRDNAVDVTRVGGLSVTSTLDAQSYNTHDTELPPPPTPEQSDEQSVGTVTTGSADIPVFETEKSSAGLPLFRFDRWAMGGVPALMNNESALVADLATKKPDERASGLMNIAKMYLANARGSEALGYLRLVSELEPALVETPEFMGLRGAAYAVNGQFDLSYEDLRNETLNVYPDINAWRAYTLANLQDWQQAKERMSDGASWARQYPTSISQPMLLSFAEIALRSGDASGADKILSTLSPAAGQIAKEGAGDEHGAHGTVPENASAALPSYIAQRDYLFGESARQRGQKDVARKFWEPLSKGVDDKYRARARLALTVLDYEEGKIKPDAAVDQLEGLRYAWRGDEVEAAINARLGDIYLDRGDYLRGLNVLRDAAALAPDTEMGRRITATMTNAFQSLFLGDKVKKIDPIDAITVFEKFSELIPAGPDANRLTMNLVDRLMEVDLLDRAARVLTDLVDHKLEGDQRVEASLRLAATYLLNRQPQQAISTLNKTNEMFAALGNPETIARRKSELTLLRARALYQTGQVDAALGTLAAMPETPAVLRSRADIAWQTARWGDAASALERLLALQPLEDNKPPTPAQAELIRNLAVATNLSGDRGRLAQLRDQYDQAMLQTDFAQQFDVVTRERQTPTLADRDTLNKLVSEVDIFGTFLNAYRASEIAEEKAGITPSASKDEKTAEEPTPNLNPRSVEDQVIEAD